MKTHDQYIQELLIKARKCALAFGIELSTLGYRVANDGEFFPNLEGGATCTVRTYAKINAQLDKLLGDTPVKTKRSRKS